MGSEATQFKPSVYTAVELFDVLREVTLAARADSPERTAPSEYDAELVEDAAEPQPRWPGAPTAEATRRRLGRMPWYELLELVHSKRDPAHYLAIVRRKDQWSIIREEAVVALQTAARALDRESVRPGEYDRWRDGRVAQDRRRWASPDRVERLLPTAAQIDALFREEDSGTGWEQGLTEAGVRYREHVTSRGLDPVLMLDRFLGDLGCLPHSADALREYARARHLSLARLTGSFDDYIDEARTSRTQRRLWTPPAAPPEPARPKIELGRDDSDPANARQYEWANLEVIVESLVEGMDLAHERGLNFTQPVHRDLAHEHPGRVASPTVVSKRAKQEGKTAKALRARAARLRRDRAREAAPPRTLELPYEAEPAVPKGSWRPTGRPPGRPRTKPQPSKPKPTAAERAAAQRARRRERHEQEQAKRSEPVQRKRRLVYIPDLIDAGLLEVGQGLVWARDGREHRATVLASGRLLMDGVEYRSPTGAVTAIVGQPGGNGWKHWRLASDPDVRLQDLRERWAQANQDTAAASAGRSNGAV